MTREKELEEEVRDAERNADIAWDELSSFKETIADCCNQLEQALAEKEPQDREDQIRRVIRRLENAA